MSDDVVTRAATPADAADVERIVRAAYARYVGRIGREPAPMTVDYRSLIATTDHVTVAVDGAAGIVGVLVTVAAPDHLFVENVAIAPHAQGRGHGRMLLSLAERQARERGLAEIRLYTNVAMTENLALYPRLGYVEVDRRHAGGFERVYFVKHLSPS
jgi:ribosomal protein S18 acetylase RimI-like enzyme